MSLAYTKRGSGRTRVIALHGFLGSGRNLSTLVNAWSSRDPRIAIAVPDLRGHGASPPLDEGGRTGADLDTLAADVLELARSIDDAAPVHLVGHSLGGRVALRASLIDPNRIASVLLLDSSPGGMGAGAREELDRVVAALLAAPAESATREEMQAALRGSGLSQGLANWLATNLAPDGDRYRWKIDRSALAELLPRTRKDDLWPAVERPGARIAMVRGARSTFVSEEAAERVKRAGHPLVTIEGAGHFLHVDRPKEVLEAVIASSAATAAAAEAS